MTKKSLKKAVRKGKTIQYNFGTKENPDWVDWPNPAFDDEPIDEHYRIKPEEENERLTR